MSVGRVYPRDLALPARAGDGDLRPLVEREALEFVRRESWRGVGPAPESASIAYVRWKPGISSSTCYEVQFEDGLTALVTIKIYKASRIKHATREIIARRGGDGDSDRLTPLLFLEGISACMWTFPVDPVLRGLERARDVRRIARQIDGLPGVAPWQMRLRASRLETLRYKPERRAVQKLDARLRRGPEERSERTFVIRVHAPDDAREIHRRRTVAGGPVPVPLLFEERTGLIIDPWLPGTSPEPLDFSHARQTGAALVPLHECMPEPDHAESLVRRDLSGLSSLFSVNDQLAALFARFEASAPLPVASWVHGDVHPDQLLLTPAAPVGLLDWDSLRPGRPAEDLASWIADALSAGSESAAELLAGYEEQGGTLPDTDELTGFVRCELVERAAAAVRRLEAGATDKARRLLERAIEADLGARL